jgi:hypothetical protein
MMKKKQYFIKKMYQLFIGYVKQNMLFVKK